jgi:hypothetical protein
MATYGGTFVQLPFRADVDFNTHQYKFVCAASTAGYVKVGTGASNPFAFGVVQNDPRPNEEATVRFGGISKVLAIGGGIGYGGWVQCGSTGAAETATAGSAVAGMALEALATGSGYISVLLMPQLTVVAAS